jgi:HlyD family secretion protein
MIETRKIKTGISNWEFTEVQDGLVEGEMVVLSVDRQGVEDGVSASAE